MADNPLTTRFAGQPGWVWAAGGGVGIAAVVALVRRFRAGRASSSAAGGVAAPVGSGLGSGGGGPGGASSGQPPLGMPFPATPSAPGGTPAPAPTPTPSLSQPAAFDAALPGFGRLAAPARQLETVSGSIGGKPVVETLQGFYGQYLAPAPNVDYTGTVDLVDPRTGLAAISGITKAEASRYDPSRYLTQPHGSTPIPTGEGYTPTPSTQVAIGS